ncbi:MAG: PAS domain-containing sensor histidine kinase [Nitrosotalea sp.]
MNSTRLVRNEKIVKLLFETTPDMLAILDKDGKILDCNHHLTESFGYDKNEVIGKIGPVEMVSNRDSKRAVEAFTQLVTDGIKLNVPLEALRKNKSTFYSIWSGARLSDESGNIEGYLVTGKDLTEVSKLEEKYRNLYEHSPDLLRTVDLDGVITDCNESYAESLGYSRDEIIGASILSHTAEDSLTEMSSQFQEWKTSGKVTNKEIWLKRKDKTVFPALLSGTNIYDYNGKVTGRTVSLRDITDIYDIRKTLEENNQKLQNQHKEVLSLVKKLEELNEHLREEKKQSTKLVLIGEKISQMNHNLRNPLHVVMMNADLINILAKKDGNENIVAKSETIKKASDSMLVHIGDLMNFIRDETLELEKKSLNEILNDAASLVQKPGTISIQLPENDVVCRCDPHKIQVVFMNLFTNAIEAMGDVGKITVRSKETSAGVIIEVEDSGEGIPPEIVPRIFSSPRYFR